MTEVEAIEQLTPLQLDELDRHCRNWLALARSTAAIDKLASEQAIKTIYGWLQLPPPVIFWCRSPWQLALMPLVVQMLTLSPRFSEWRDDFAANADDRLWQELWQDISLQMNSRVRLQLQDPPKVLDGGPYKADRGNLDRLRSEEHNHRFARGPRMGFWDHPSGLWDNFSLSLLAAQHELVAELNVVGNAIFKREAGHQLRSHFDEQFRTNINAVFRGQMERHFGNLSWQSISSELLEKMPVQNLIDLIGQSVEEQGFAWQSETPNSAAIFLDAIGLDSKIQFSAYFNWLIRSIWWGPWSIDWLPLHEFLLANFQILPQSPYSRAELTGWCNLARQASAYTFFERACFVCERPLELKQDERSRFHCADGPAISFADGYEIYSWHGISVSKEIIESPDSIDVKSIQFERNAEVRRVMIERFGAIRFITESGAKKYQEDECGILYRKDLHGDEPIVMVKVINKTQEPDGTFKEYFLRVPPTITTAREAVAWSFGMQKEEYSPARET